MRGVLACEWTEFPVEPSFEEAAPVEPSFEEAAQVKPSFEEAERWVGRSLYQMLPRVMCR